MPTPSTQADRFAELNRKVAEGRAAEAARADLILQLRREDPELWTQVRLAQAAGITQQAVSRILARAVDNPLENLHPADVTGCWSGVLSFIDDQLRGRGQAWKTIEPWWTQSHLPAGVVAQATPAIARDLKTLRETHPAAAELAEQTLEEIYARGAQEGSGLGVEERMNDAEAIAFMRAYYVQRGNLTEKVAS
ncbi:MarR family transcriptional regulator [Streptomyces aidingensis]|uniref:Uncharacterized protein n=1 Tax=Streptomyces aidingensis TaxID=910347 RepID=A0A1I1PY29_9ACTN|nr:MarR family transcriptional regulator [Streptomyces aidingensis]SFD14607.1 hypothetical protein SAMN05421773_110129 [Streptomyces aidingensis]